MKKILLVLSIIGFYLLFGHIVTEKNLIPEEAIRIRVIANSDSKEDQQLKLQVKKELEEYYSTLLSDVKNKQEAESLIVKHLKEAENLVSNKTSNYKLNYGKNYFPQKEYKGITYKEGYYDSVVVTLGKGVGKNWWCVLFPPLCLLENKEMEDIEYRSLVADIIHKYF